MYFIFNIWVYIVLEYYQWRSAEIFDFCQNNLNSLFIQSIPNNNFYSAVFVFGQCVCVRILTYINIFIFLLLNKVNVVVLLADSVNMQCKVKIQYLLHVLCIYCIMTL